MEIDLKLDGNNLYREESFTDMKTGAVRRLTPVKSDGSDDESREAIFIAQTQLMSPEGALPVSAMLEAKTLAQAIQNFPEAVKNEVDRIVEIAQKAKQEESSGSSCPARDKFILSKRNTPPFSAGCFFLFLTYARKII
jgi:hypothetical protein